MGQGQHPTSNVVSCFEVGAITAACLIIKHFTRALAFITRAPAFMTSRSVLYTITAVIKIKQRPAEIKK
jgi:hypothetical protein